MRKVLEVIVTSVTDAIEAQAGGADRLELVRDFRLGGLTPEFDTVTSVIAAVQVPVRIMLRENPAMSAENQQEILRLQEEARRLARLRIDGLVAGFLRNGAIDTEAMRAICSAAPECHFTFHRAFDEVRDAAAALRELKKFPQIDRILTSGGDGEWCVRRSRLLTWQRAVNGQITLLVGAGLSFNVLNELARIPELREVHVGRAARANHSIEASVSRDAVRKLRDILQ
jgi:copper homeostasis protein